MIKTRQVPLVIDGKDVEALGNEKLPVFQPNPDVKANAGITAVGATPAACTAAVESCNKAFKTWQHTPPPERRRLFNELANILRARSAEIGELIQEEITCSAQWAEINVKDSIAIAEQVAATVTSGVLSGTIPVAADPNAEALVYKEPLGVVLGIAPWNAPLILGLRSVAPAVACGNTAVLKGSEMCPRIHFLIADLFRQADFPPGVVNFVQHKTEDASACFEALISHRAVKKCNFTGSTNVGRSIAQRAAFYLKPVLLELGGKNFAVVLKDADLEAAATNVLVGGLLNSGQICMSTDMVLVDSSIVKEFTAQVRQKQANFGDFVTGLINEKGSSRVQALTKNAMEKGAGVSASDESAVIKPTIIENVTDDMEFWTQESFGPLIGIRAFSSEDEAVEMVNSSNYGLSGAVFSRNHYNAIRLAKRLETGAVHINSPTVHDEAALPHGGRKESGWGRFGAAWGFEEFLQTKVITIHP